MSTSVEDGIIVELSGDEIVVWKRDAVVVVIDDNASCRSGLKGLFESVGLKVKLYEIGDCLTGRWHSRHYELLGD